VGVRFETRFIAHIDAACDYTLLINITHKHTSVYSNVLCCIRWMWDRLCGLVVRVLGYRSESLSSIPGNTIKKK
jgi:hypothetical protein